MHKDGRLVLWRWRRRWIRNPDGVWWTGGKTWCHFGSPRWVARDDTASCVAMAAWCQVIQEFFSEWCIGLFRQNVSVYFVCTLIKTSSVIGHSLVIYKKINKSRYISIPLAIDNYIIHCFALLRYLFAKGTSYSNEASELNGERTFITIWKFQITSPWKYGLDAEDIGSEKLSSSKSHLLLGHPFVAWLLSKSPSFLKRQLFPSSNNVKPRR